jgi:hypothetical protein
LTVMPFATTTRPKLIVTPSMCRIVATLAPAI